MIRKRTTLTTKIVKEDKDLLVHSSQSILYARPGAEDADAADLRRVFRADELRPRGRLDLEFLSWDHVDG